MAELRDKDNREAKAIESAISDVPSIIMDTGLVPYVLIRVLEGPNGEIAKRLILRAYKVSEEIRESFITGNSRNMQLDDETTSLQLSMIGFNENMRRAKAEVALDNVTSEVIATGMLYHFDDHRIVLLQDIDYAKQDSSPIIDFVRVITSLFARNRHGFEEYRVEYLRPYAPPGPLALITAYKRAHIDADVAEEKRDILQRCRDIRIAQVRRRTEQYEQFPPTMEKLQDTLAICGRFYKHSEFHPHLPYYEDLQDVTEAPLELDDPECGKASYRLVGALTQSLETTLDLSAGDVFQQSTEPKRKSREFQTESLLGTELAELALSRSGPHPFRTLLRRCLRRCCRIC